MDIVKPDEKIVLDKKTELPVGARYFKTHAFGDFKAKDRSGALEYVEVPNLGIIRDKMLSSSIKMLENKKEV
jgi:hypothetical protein